MRTTLESASPIVIGLLVVCGYAQPLSAATCAGPALPIPLVQDAASQDAASDKTTVIGEGDSIWAYLAGKYDTDADGVISFEEYDRGEEAFGRLDRDGDGKLAEADFASSGGGRRRGPPPEMLGQLVVSMYFQADDDQDELTRDELTKSFAMHDTDADGQLVRAEFEAAVETRGGSGMPMRGMDRYDALLTVADGDGDARLTEAELLAYFDATDTDGNGRWTTPGRRARGPGRGGNRSREDEGAPAAEGKIAPDIRLEPLHGGEPVSLSSWTGKRPVALIFGSYT